MLPLASAMFTPAAPAALIGLVVAVVLAHVTPRHLSITSGLANLLLRRSAPCPCFTAPAGWPRTTASEPAVERPPCSWAWGCSPSPCCPAGSVRLFSPRYQIGRASGRERGCQYVCISVGAVALK